MIYNYYYCDYKMGVLNEKKCKKKLNNILYLIHLFNYRVYKECKCIGIRAGF